mgnify:CR=1 FL=1
MKMPYKSFYKSKTLWLNVLAVGTYAAKTALGIDSVPDIDPVLLALLNIVLRLVTKKPIGV